jgi:hypothetical protein
MDNRIYSALAAAIVASAFVVLVMQLVPEVSEPYTEPPENLTAPVPEPVPEIPFGADLAALANEQFGGQLLHTKTNETSMNGWLRLSFTVPDEVKLPYLCHAFMGRRPIREVGDAVFTDMSDESNETCRIGVSGAAVSACGRLDIFIEIGEMVSGYNASQDNWKDFFSCVPEIDSEFCRSECDTLVEGLMKMERSPFLQ